ncbi:hypothetical protein COX95_00975 [bacterium CG_4_10_14_0_2_um_filter_33_32]|nr:MAG: hypothetical protein AUJ93_01155 [bacterium CG2_30_33_46]PIU76876.1 MAG: hypothetical protein COS74_01665 [bacterium CG06_land_8_20_14_3_00_33_50]PIW81679.1 MAG: hypothetical protein COZ97_00590 [bacterium CG_4_8_14_3_um_filter_33_28]PIY84989.1 MAG: hypothetical protein COY76_04585 [bacterium CG_4_10_14_0_8_um_filter_33_57]PIZ86549.1 MAG: hypothetical protein COX95_00975 [bacterium CG_4_10_14_0_2_um_filter_33_32]PJA72208.1 MAG: hypothetical protein CO152_02545 [bacterium CG_4_9_14_3_um
MEIKILGTGCLNCNKLEANTKQAIKNLQVKANIIKVTDLTEILSYGIMSTPALVIDGEIKAVGMIPDVEDIEEIIRSLNK